MNATSTLESSATGTTAANVASPEAVTKAVVRARNVFNSGATRPLAARRRNLESIRRMREENRTLFEEALRADLHKSKRESGTTEIDVVIGEVAHTLRHLKRWTSARRVRTSATLWPNTAHVVPEPLGVVLVMAPWNYPVNLTLDPLVGILASGNTAVIKPSPESE